MTKNCGEFVPSYVTNKSAYESNENEYNNESKHSERVDNKNSLSSKFNKVTSQYKLSNVYLHNAEELSKNLTDTLENGDDIPYYQPFGLAMAYAKAMSKSNAHDASEIHRQASSDIEKIYDMISDNEFDDVSYGGY